MGVRVINRRRVTYDDPYQVEHERLLDRWAEVRSTISAMGRAGEIVPDSMWNELDELERKGYGRNPRRNVSEPWGASGQMADLYRQGFMRHYLKAQEKSMKKKRTWDVWDDDGWVGSRETKKDAENLAWQQPSSKHARVQER